METSGSLSSSVVVRSRLRGGVRFGLLLALACTGSLVACGVAADPGSGATLSPDSGAPATDNAVADEATTAATTSVVEPGVGSVTSEVVAISDPAAPTTAIAIDVVASPPATTPQPAVIGDAAVQALAFVLGVEGEIEQRDGEQGSGQCIGRLEPRGLCVNVPLWGVWQYWDLAAQDNLGASDDQARAVAVDLFARLGVDPGAVISIEPNGPLPQVTFSSGTLVVVAEDGRIASVTARTDLLPAG